MSEQKKCPKCGGDMQLGHVHGDFRIKKQGDIIGDEADAIYCRECGFIELYKQASTKESWRWKREEKTPITKTQKREEIPQVKPEQRGKKRLVR